MLLMNQYLLSQGITSPPTGQSGTYGTGAKYVTAPASGATITLWTSPTNSLLPTLPEPIGVRYKRIIVGLFVSHASLASGLQFDVSVDAVNWRNLVSYSIAATTLTENYVSTAAPHLRVRYVNDANTLTTWEMWVIGDEYERATQ